SVHLLAVPSCLTSIAYRESTRSGLVWIVPVSRRSMTPNGQPATQVPQPLQISSWTTTVPYSVRYKAPVGHTSKHPAKVQCLHTSELISHRNSGVSGFGGLSTFSLMRVPGEPNSGIPICLALSFCRVSGAPIEGIPRLTSF